MMEVTEVKLGGLGIVYLSEGDILAVKVFADKEKATNFARLVQGAPCVVRLYFDPETAKKCGFEGKTVQVDPDES